MNQPFGLPAGLPAGQTTPGASFDVAAWQSTQNRRAVRETITLAAVGLVQAIWWRLTFVPARPWLWWVGVAGVAAFAVLACAFSVYKNRLAAAEMRAMLARPVYPATPAPHGYVPRGPSN